MLSGWLDRIYLTLSRVLNYIKRYGILLCAGESNKSKFERKCYLMGILDKFFKVKKSDYSDSSSFSSEKVQGQYFDPILNEGALYERVAALCSMDLFEYFMPLSDLDDRYIYSIDGNVFAKDGCGGYYVLLCDESVGYVNFSENECGRVSDSVKDLLELELNCAYSWHNYLDKNYFQNISLLKKDAPSLEVEGHEQFGEAYGDKMPSYAELQKDIVGKLDLNISMDITEDVLPRLYQSVQKQPEFVATSKIDKVCLGKLYQ